MHCVDKFVVFDDVQFIKSGWINRNRILIDGKDHLFTFSLKKAEQSLMINKREFSEENAIDKKRFTNTLMLNYAKAPFFKPTYSLVEEIFAYEERNVSKFIVNSLRILCQHLGLKTDLLSVV